jgi:mono/diheme cytochrome c family protein
MPRISRPRFGILILIMLIASGWVLVWHPAIPPIQAPTQTAFAPEQIERGAVLAAVGDCAVCHTAGGGRSYAGGRAVPTPFGTVYATNITPDPETGIGRWSEAAFQRTMRDGIDRSGRHLYPVLPYPHFTRATDQDIAAMYAFLMTRAPVSQTTPPNHDLPFPLNMRVLLAGWNLLYLKPGPWQPDPAHDATWNRGAYLTEAIGHCGACHTPHNALGAERNSEKLAGGQAENWYAPALQEASPAAEPWTEEIAHRLSSHRLGCPPRRRGRADDGGDRAACQGSGTGCPRDGGLRRVADAQIRARVESDARTESGARCPGTGDVRRRLRRLPCSGCTHDTRRGAGTITQHSGKSAYTTRGDPGRPAGNSLARGQVGSIHAVLRLGVYRCTGGGTRGIPAGDL